MKNQFNRKLNDTHAKNIEEKINTCIHDSKQLWREIKLITKGPNETNFTMSFDGQLFCDRSVIATMFNEYSIRSINEICDRKKNKHLV